MNVATITIRKTGMFNSFRRGVVILRESLVILKRFPKFLLPLLVCWVFYAVIALYFKFTFPWKAFELPAQIAVVLLIIIALSTIIGVSSLVMLEMVRQVESDRPVRLGSAFAHTMSNDLPQFEDVEQPSILDHVPEFVNLGGNTS